MDNRKTENQCADASHCVDDQREKCLETKLSLNTLEGLTTELRSKLDEEKQHSSAIQNELDHMNYINMNRKRSNTLNVKKDVLKRNNMLMKGKFSCNLSSTSYVK